jgi:hypothetical protein
MLAIEYGWLYFIRREKREKYFYGQAPESKPLPCRDKQGSLKSLVLKDEYTLLVPINTA